jgi:hypothetical protein
MDPVWLFTNNPRTNLPYFCDTSVIPVRFDPALDIPNAAAAEMSSTITPIENYIWASSYLYNPHWATCNHNGNAPGTTNAMYGQQVSWYIRASQYPPTETVVCDMIRDTIIIAHRTNTSFKYNLGFIDGHVTTVQDSKYIFKIPNTGRWPGTSTTGNPLGALDDDIDILEAEADNRDPATSPGVSGATLWMGAGAYIYRVQKDAAASMVGASPTSPSTDTNTNHPAVPWL